MEIGINLYSKLPYSEIIESFVENGVKRTFVMTNHPQFDEVMNALAENNIIVENLHAPYNNINSMWCEGEEGDAMLQTLLDSVLSCAKYDVHILVVHPSSGRPMPPITDVGIKRYNTLVQYAKENDVTITFENHKFFENVKYLMDMFPEAGFCWDTGHEQSFTQGIEYMPLWGKRVVALHINDSECILDRDVHLIPFDGKMDFEKVAKYIADYKCDCSLMLEIKPGNHQMYKDMTVKEYYAKAAERVRKLADMVDSYLGFTTTE